MVTEPADDSANRYRLDVWLYGTRTAELTQVRGGKVVLQFTDAAIGRWGEGSPVLSVSLPVRTERYSNAQAMPWVAALLPEGDARSAAEQRFATPAGNTFALLKALGSEFAGAAYFVAAGTEPVTAGPAATHTLRPEGPALGGSVLNEALCLTAARLLGLTTLAAEVDTIDGVAVLNVARSDRQLEADCRVTRIHQEHLCQALGLDAAARYEAGGGPTLRAVATLLDDHADDGLEQLQRLMGLAVFNAAIGNTEAHGTAMALLHDDTGATVLAPVDSLMSTTQPSTTAPPSGDRPVSRVMAMSVNRETSIDAVTLDDFEAEARAWPFDDASLDQAMTAATEVLDGLTAALTTAAAQVGAPEDLVERLIGRGEALGRGERAGDGDPLVNMRRLPRRRTHRQKG